MAQENENKLEVIADFIEKDVKVMRFRLNDKVYNVDKNANRVSGDVDGKRASTFILICEKQNTICELRFFHHSFKWELLQMDTLD